MWNEAEREFNELTKKNLRADREKSLNEVLQEFEKKYKPPGYDSGKDTGRMSKGKIRETILKVLNCIQLLGGLAAQGASIVFGPATLCFNAISFLIDVPGKVASVHDGIGTLFEEVSQFLTLFRIYHDYETLDPEIGEGAHTLMVSVVRICGLSIKM